MPSPGNFISTANQEQRKISEGHMGEAAKDVLIRNIQALLALDEPDASLRASVLAGRMGISAQTGSQLLSQGSDSLSTIEHIAAALQVTPATLIDSTLVESTVVRARLTIDDADFPVVAWLDPTPSQPWNADWLVGREDTTGWRIERFGKGGRAPGHRVRHYQSQGQPLSRSTCVVAVYIEEAACLAEAICESLTTYGFSAQPAGQEEDLYRLSGMTAPDVAIVSALHYETINRRLETANGRIVPTIVIDDQKALAKLSDPGRGLFYAEETAMSILVLLRSVVQFAKPTA